MMKKRSIRLLIGVAVILILLLAYFGLRAYNERTEVEEQEEAAGETILEIDPDSVTEISFLLNGVETVFEQDTEGNWKKSDDETFPVNDALLLYPLDYLVPLKSVRTLTEAEDPSEYGLDNPQNVITLKREDGEETVLTIGDTNEVTGNDYLILNGDTQTVYTVASGLRESIYEDLYDYAISEEIPEIQASEITGISLSGSDRDGYDLYIEDALWMVDGKEADSDLANELSSALGGLDYEGYYDHNCTDPAEYGLDNPAAVLTITWEEPEEEEAETGLEEEETQSETETSYTVYKISFDIGNEDAEGNYYVQMEGSLEVHSFSGSMISMILGYSAEDLLAE